MSYRFVWKVAYEGYCHGKKEKKARNKKKGSI